MTFNQSQREAMTGFVVGRRVDKAAATLPASTNQTLFTVTTGRVLLLGIVGEVTTVVQTQACNAKLTSAPTTGTAVDLCAVLNISADEAGCLYGITGLFSDALVGANAGAAPIQDNPIVIPIGVIRLNTSATNTGATKWTAYYVPLDDGALMV